jgi:hypothetical protein
MHPSSILLVNSRRAGQSPLGQRADGNQTANDGVWVLVPLGHGAGQRLVTVCRSLHWVVMVPGQHTRLEWADDLGTFTDRAHVLGGHGTHAGRSRLARVPVGLPILAMHGDRLALPVLNVAGTNDGSHWYYEWGKSFGSQTALPGGLLETFEEHLELCLV